MKYRRFGRTGISMPVISFGCMRSMHSWQDNPLTMIPAPAQTDLETIVSRAMERGINHLETAHGYGSSERQLGTILPNFSRDDYILQTKVEPNENPHTFVNDVTRSMTRLGVDRLDLLALHGINDHRTLWYSCRKNGCLAAARGLQDRGLIGHIGFSGHGPLDVIMAALQHREDGGFDFVNLHWYYIFDVNRPALEYADDNDIGVFIISPSDKGGHLYQPPAKLVHLCAPLSPMLFNDIYCLRQRGVCTISVGASAPEHFEEHLRALPFLEPDTPEPAEAVDVRLRAAMLEGTGVERPDALWNRLPPWEQAPGNINLRMILWLDRLYHGWDMSRYCRARYEMLGTGSNWVQGNNASAAATLDFSSLEQLGGIEPDELQRTVIRVHETLKKQH